MNFQKCCLYGVSSLSELSELLGSDISQFVRSEYLWRQYHIEFDGTHIIEGPSNTVKQIQRTILSFLYELDYPDYVYSVRGRSFVDGTASHINTANHVIKMDIYKFFLSTGREKVYRFWKDTMNTSATVAAVLTNLTTVDLRKCSLSDVTEFLRQNRLCISHLGFGLPTSIVLSFLCNMDMFEELEEYALNNRMILSVFVDDIILSAEKNVTRADFDLVKRIIMDHGYKINKKSKYRNGDEPIAVTGLFLSRKGMGVPNRKQKEYVEFAKYLSFEPDDNEMNMKYQGLKGYISSVRKVNAKK